MIPYGRQDITQEDIEAVIGVLRSDWLTQGPSVPRFEEAVASYVGARHAVAVNSATSALHVACMAVDLAPGDWLWTVPITFVASANCALYCGANVDFVDIDPHTYTLCPKALEEKLLVAERCGRLPKVVVPVHLCGLSCDMQAIGQLADRFGFRVIEDASHAIGGMYQGERIGDCRYSDITVFSFHPVKIITTAEGGMALTNDAALAEKMSLLRSHGITRDPALMSHPPDGFWYYQQIELGYNYRLTDLHAALGLSQLQRIDAYVAKRHEIARRYTELIADLPVATQRQPPYAHSALHLYVIRLQLDRMIRSHREVLERLRAEGIGANVHYIPVHTQPYYQQRGFGSGSYPESERYYAESISLPMFPLLDDERQARVVEVLREAVLS